MERCDECGSTGRCRPGCGLNPREETPEPSQEAQDELSAFVRRCIQDCIEGR